MFRKAGEGQQPEFSQSADHPGRDGADAQADEPSPVSRVGWSETQTEPSEAAAATPEAVEQLGDRQPGPRVRRPAPERVLLPSEPVHAIVPDRRRSVPDVSGEPRRKAGTASPLERPPKWAFSAIIDECVGALATLDDSAVQSVGVTSCSAGDGRTLIATALAIANRCDYRSPTILAEFDLSSPSLAARLTLESSPGVAEILRGQASIEDCVQWPFDGLGVLVAGEVGDNEAELLTQLPAADLSEALTLLADVVIIDLPPVGSPGAAVQMAELCEQLILVVRAGKTPIDIIRQTVDPLQPNPLVILNRVVRRGPAWLDRMLGGGR